MMYDLSSDSIMGFWWEPTESATFMRNYFTCFHATHYFNFEVVLMWRWHHWGWICWIFLCAAGHLIVWQRVEFIFVQCLMLTRGKRVNMLSQTRELCPLMSSSIVNKSQIILNVQSQSIWTPLCWSQQEMRACSCAGLISSTNKPPAVIYCKYVSDRMIIQLVLG